LRTGTCNEPETLLPARSANHIEDRISRFLHQVRRRPPTTVRVELPPPVKDLLQKTAPGAENRRQLGDAPDRVRLAVAQLPDVLSHLPGLELIVDGATAEDLPRMLAAIRADRLLIALPPVFFDSDLERVRSLLNVCARHRLPVEVNNWGGWRLARSAGVRMEGGPGLPVLNSLAARALASLGLVAVTLSQEADREQLQDLTQVCPVPCSLVVYGRPPLLLTRVRVPQRWLGHVFEDRRGIRLVPQTEGGLTCFRPHNAFSLRDCHNPQIRARHLVVDLVGAPDPVAEWQRLGTRQADAFHFNYDRALS
jgi:hypothetical protein